MFKVDPGVNRFIWFTHLSQQIIKMESLLGSKDPDKIVMDRREAAPN